MGTFKITNITHLLGKREHKFNSVLDVDYVDNMMKKTIKIKAGNTVYLTTPSLPISAHLLRVKNLITVVEVSDNELASAKVKPTVKPEAQPVVKIKPVVQVEEPPKPAKKNVVKEEVTN
jgi:hypothetical protein